MKRAIQSLVLFLALATAVFAQEPRVEQPRTEVDPKAQKHSGMVSAAFWNIEWFPGGPGSRSNVTAEQIQNHVDIVAKILDEKNPTIFIASEIRNLEAAVMLNKQLKHPYPYLAVTDYLADNSNARESDANRQEHALFSRVPWTKVWEVDFGSLPQAEDKPSRGFIGAQFILDGRTITVYGVHPKANYIRPGDREPEKTALKNVEKRERASELLLEDMKRLGLHPLKDRIIVMGDFNTDLYAERFQGEKSLKRILQAGFFDSFDGLEPAAKVTVPKKKGAKWPDTTFDYILTSVGLGKYTATVVQRGVAKDAAAGPGMPGVASDHYMVTIDLSLLPDQRRED